MANNPRFHVRTYADIFGRIVQEVQRPELHPGEDIRSQVFQTILDTKEQQVHDALVQLGWMPPQDSKLMQAAFIKAIRLSGGHVSVDWTDMDPRYPHPNLVREDDKLYNRVHFTTK